MMDKKEAAREKNRLRMAAWRKQHPEKARGVARKHYEAHRDEMCEVQRKYYKEHREEQSARGRERSLRRNFGLTVEDYDAMLSKQFGVCALCGRSPNGRRLAVDHDHDTGRVGGLLCDACNRQLGVIEAHGPGWTTRVQAYIDRSYEGA